MSFQIHALDAADFAHLFDLSDTELKKSRARRVFADEPNCFPCRVSLTDAKVGEELVLVNYAHQKQSSPYDATHAIYVRKGVETARPNVDAVPDVLTRRLLSVRAFGRDHLMHTADVVEGVDLASQLQSYFTDADIEYVHIHNAKQGCFAALAVRAD